MKTCRKCGVEKPLSAYHPNKTCRQGVVGRCRQCTEVVRRAWYAANRKVRQDKANQTNRNNKAYWVEQHGGKCLDCSGVFPQCVYQFHHVDGSKEANPSKVMNWGFERAKKEMDKCVMLCANCHMIRHHGGDNE